MKKHCHIFVKSSNGDKSMCHWVFSLLNYCRSKAIFNICKKCVNLVKWTMCVNTYIYIHKVAVTKFQTWFPKLFLSNKKTTETPQNTSYYVILTVKLQHTYVCTRTIVIWSVVSVGCQSTSDEPDIKFSFFRLRTMAHYLVWKINSGSNIERCRITSRQFV